MFSFFDIQNYSIGNQAVINFFYFIVCIIINRFGAVVTQKNVVSSANIKHLLADKLFETPFTYIKNKSVNMNFSDDTAFFSFLIFLLSFEHNADKNNFLMHGNVIKPQRNSLYNTSIYKIRN